MPEIEKVSNDVIEACNRLLDALRDYPSDTIFLRCDQCGTFIAAISPDELEDYYHCNICGEYIVLCANCLEN